MICGVNDEGPAGPGRLAEVGGVADGDRPARQFGVVQLGGDTRAALKAGPEILLAMTGVLARAVRPGPAEILCQYRTETAAIRSSARRPVTAIICWRAGPVMARLP